MFSCFLASSDGTATAFFFFLKIPSFGFSDARFGDVSFMFDVVVVYIFFFCDTKNS